ncbi:MAG TPA: type ISP restriction/modification enzyme, partial [Mucilaginibacter sp.]
MTILQYIEQVQKLYKSGLSSEHSYRGDLRTLLESIVPGVMVTNEPKRIDCGAPDYIITRNEIPVGYIEAKDLGKDLGHKDHKGQFDRYRKALNNLIITDYIDFWLFIDGELKTQLKIAEIVDHQIKPIPENFEQFNALIKSFCTHVGQTIKSASKLSVMMADKAKLLAEVIESALNSDVENEEDSSLKEQMHAFKDILIHDITPKEFADIYAQTIAYGMFAARLHDTTLDTFTRQEAAELIPKTNPFLRKLFQYVAGYDLDSRIVWIVDALADIFRATDVAALLQNFGKATQMNDPIIHFYETFLAEYDPKLRKSRGVWYTPEPVVNFIVRAVDDILKIEFNLPNGLADNSKIKIKQKLLTKATTDQRSKLKEVETEIEVHKVQILDPATGTGTFLAEVVKQVYSKFKGQQGVWSNYVENHLIPRLNGFELLMASYAMAHLKLDMLLAETGFKSTKNQRFRIYLTNSLEEHHQDTGTLFANWLSSEANEANHIKRDTPVMVVMGNPPYSGESANKGEWIEQLIKNYKKEPGGVENLRERNSKWLNDDYVKFLRYGQHFIEKNGEGVLAFINPHGFLSNPTFRGMRWSLLNTFDKIYTIDLHGNSKIKEVCPDGSADNNVFDIQQGVSINLFIKTNTKSKSELGNIYHYDLFGKREFKYEFLFSNSIASINFELINIQPPNFYFKNGDLILENIYNQGFRLNELFLKYSIGIQTHRDELVVDFNKNDLTSKIEEVFNNNSAYIKNKYKIQESSSWTLDKTKNKEHSIKIGDIKHLNYRPFDQRFIYYNDSFVDRTRRSLGKEFEHPNYGLNFPKIVKVLWNHSIITNIIPTAISLDINGSYFAPLYLYLNTTGGIFENKVLNRIPNFSKVILNNIEKNLNLTLTDDEQKSNNNFAPI